MQTATLGGQLRVSRLCLGMMSFGATAWAPWVLDLAQAREVFCAALGHGVNFFDTSNSYSDGESERMLGRLVREHAARENVVLASKVGLPTLGGIGLAPAEIRRQLEGTLRRLHTDYLDLYQIHTWDEQVPIADTLGALEALRERGLIRAYGCSNLDAAQLAQAAAAGGRGFASAQLQINLLYREELVETVPWCRAHDVGVLAYSPLARGRLLGQAQADNAVRLSTDAKGDRLYGAAGGQMPARLAALAAQLGMTPAQLALAWVLAQPGVDGLIVGAMSPAQLAEAAEALARLPDATALAALDEGYRPREFLRVRLPR
ncbi:aldo/keto reductase [Verticiella sediminum]|uniref:Aldo/keto reductase n=1 Tax=Verticiella sediminum TaxID=1247510 RepID=A0A556AVE6_9BURK|nr:aldo/keto reductase [Verticiella sediminum]TSH96897.1 aldo/keto reductase [Verticiella sediminum]